MNLRLTGYVILFLIIVMLQQMVLLGVFVEYVLEGLIHRYEIYITWLMYIMTTGMGMYMAFGACAYEYERGKLGRGGD